MNYQTVESYNAEHRLHCLTVFLKNGFHKLTTSKHFPAILSLYLMSFFAVLYTREKIFSYSQNTHLYPIQNTLAISAILLLTVLLTLAAIAYIGVPKNCFSFYRNLRRIGLVTKAGEAPVLLSAHRGSTPINVLIFYSLGIPLKTWEDRQAEIESALNIHIALIYPDIDARHIVVKAVDGTTLLPEKVEWDFTAPVSFVDFSLALGESYLGTVTVNLAVIPHILIGGATGSGKTILLKSLLYQCVEKDAQVIIADFKGGVDSPRYWHEHCTFLTEQDVLIEQLDSLVKLLEERKILFRAEEARDIAAYNEYTGSNLRRIIFACDEIAELLDKTGTNKEQKEKLLKIENYLSTIARQGRAFGIHLILATQRPDANILSGQIKNNINYRVCGRADNVLSQIILDSTDAVDQIPQNAQGRFLDSDGIVFQSYYFDEKELQNLN